MPDNIYSLAKQHDHFRKSCINLIASENVLSEKVKETLTLQHSRYHAGSWYGGTVFFEKIFTETTELAKEIFRCQEAWVTPLSGNMADLAILLSLTQPGDKIAALPLIPAGGYPFNYEYLGRKKIDIPFDTERFNINIEKTMELFSKEKPQLVFLGSSFILFPQPVKEVAEVVHDYGGTVIYDASHVLGLIAGREFQDPLVEGADILVGSTHKSFPGPQGGIILSNGYKKEEIELIIGKDPLKGIVLVDNIHNSRVAALGVALEEMKDHGKIYAQQIIKNSQSLAKGLDSVGVKVRCKELGFSKSHQVLVDITDFDGEGKQKRDRLADIHIITDAGLRFGTSEITRLGYKEKEAFKVGKLAGEVITNEGLSSEQYNQILNDVCKLVNDFQRVVL